MDTWSKLNRPLRFNSPPPAKARSNGKVLEAEMRARPQAVPYRWSISPLPLPKMPLAWRSSLGHVRFSLYTSPSVSRFLIVKMFEAEMRDRPQVVPRRWFNSSSPYLGFLGLEKLAWISRICLYTSPSVSRI